MGRGSLAGPLQVTDAWSSSRLLANGTPFSSYSEAVLVGSGACAQEMGHGGHGQGCFQGKLSGPC